MPAAAIEPPNRRFDATGAAVLAGATAALTLACIWGGTRYAWDSGPILALAGTTILLTGALVVRERRAADPIVPLGLLRSPVVAIASAGMFLATASLFAVIVFVPLFLQATTGASPTQAGLLLIPMMIGVTASTNFAGRGIERTGRYKRYPVTGLALMSASLALLAVVAGDPSRVTTGIAIAVFGLGFGMVTQVLIVAVQNSVERAELGIAMATANFFRGLGGAVGAAVLGAVFAARAGAGGVTDGPTALGAAARADVIDAVQTVFAVAAPIAALALLAVLGLREVPLASSAQTGDARPRARHSDPNGGPTGAPRLATEGSHR
jgi:predicted MFS family arabinose efflux permease